MLNHERVTPIGFLPIMSEAIPVSFLSTVATSSTEAEFIAAVHPTKTAKYLHAILLGFSAL